MASTAHVGTRRCEAIGGISGTLLNRLTLEMPCVTKVWSDGPSVASLLILGQKLLYLRFLLVSGVK